MEPNLKKISWNCQGCASKNFIRAFREYNSEHRPDIVCLVEPRVSSNKANFIIEQLGFNSSHQIKAIGFSGGIWVGWKDSIRIQIIKSHPRFIFLRVDNFISNKSILISFVYGCPDRLKRKLDPALANDEWMLTFPQCLVQYLTRIKSDHRPLLLSTRSDFGMSKGRPFRFLAGWTHHNTFPSFSYNQEKKLQSYYYLTFRRWEWCSDQFILQNKVVDFFERLYDETPHSLRGTPSFGFPILTSSEVSFLEADVTNEEIKRALFDMAPLKTPGSDGYHALFFQSQWDTLGDNVCQWVKDVFSGRPIKQEINNMLIVLIPKKRES
ncbi:Endonuclease/exonuclease/phosphatase [Gossypium australe]|uniref:Endonuclease/exonuclease/phosphatase n=1 Tax=Gossypium australe TaxID=47621 RepID=A0A5B6WZ59_9ROSI|nr:Endonuclease/exonuclease/phosphatase [Gossypium australe]